VEHVISWLALNWGAIIAVIFCFGFIIFIHEFGHFIVAKRVGVRVPEFALGFGPRLFHFRRGETEYALRLFPVGGFVKLEGEDSPKADPQDPGNFQNKTVLQRMAVIAGGPLMNYVMALLTFWFVGLVWGEVGEFYLKPFIGGIFAGSAAEKAGLRTGDLIVSIDGRPVESHQDTVRIIHASPNKVLRTEYRRGTELFTKEIRTQIAVGGFPEGSSAQKAGVEPNDMAVSIGGTPIEKIDDPVALLKKKGQGPLKVGLRQGTKVTEKSFDTDTVEWTGAIGYTADMLALDVRFRKVRFGEMMAHGVKELANYTMAPFYAIILVSQKKISNKVLAESTAGPIGLGQMIAELFHKGIKPLIYFSAIINASLGIFNLFPFPALDGSRILILGISGVLRKPFGQEKEGIIHWVGFVALILLVLLISYQDVQRIISGKGFFR